MPGIDPAETGPDPIQPQPTPIPFISVRQPAPVQSTALLPHTPVEIRLLLGGLAVLAFLIVVMLAYRKYWETKGLSNRKKPRRARERVRVVCAISAFGAFLLSAFLACFVSTSGALFVAIVSSPLIVTVFAAFGHSGGRVGPGDNPYSIG